MRILDFADGFESSAEPTSVVMPASSITNTPSGNLSSTTVQGAVNELQGDIDTLNGKLGAASGIPLMGSDSKILATYLPAISLVSVSVVADIAARDALTVQSGDVAMVTDAGGGITKEYIYDGSGWIEIHSDGALAAHIANTSNPHSVTKTQVGLSDVDNTSDATKNSAVAILTNKTISGASNTFTNIPLSSGVTGLLPVANGGTNSSTSLSNDRVMKSSAGSIVEAAAITTSRALISDTNGIPTHSAVTSTELGHLSGVSSSIQTQVDSKLVNPMTNAGDMIYGGASGVGTRLAKGTDGQVLTLASGNPSWASPSAATVPTRSYEISNLGIATSVSSNALTIAIKQADGAADPSTGASSVLVGMRSSTATSGAYNQRSIASALSMTVSSGSTLGQISAKQARLFIYLIDNAGTLELAVSQSIFNENQLISTTAEGGAGTADSATVMYSTTARSNVPFRLVGYLDNTQTTAGTWTSAGTTLGVGTYNSIANEQPYMKAKGSSSAVTSGNPVIYPTTSYDSHSGYSSGRYTVKISGTYLVTFLANGAAVLYTVYVDGSSSEDVSFPVTGGLSAGSCTVKVVGGNILDVRPNGSTTPVGSLTISRIGN